MLLYFQYLKNSIGRKNYTLLIIMFKFYEKEKNCRKCIYLSISRIYKRSANGPILPCMLFMNIKMGLSMCRSVCTTFSTHE